MGTVERCEKWVYCREMGIVERCCEKLSAEGECVLCRDDERGILQK